MREQRWKPPQAEKERGFARIAEGQVHYRRNVGAYSGGQWFPYGARKA